MNLSDPSLLRCDAYVDGQWQSGAAGTRVAVTNPATGEEICTVPSLNTDETGKAVEAAFAAFKPWAARTAKERSIILREWFNLMMANQEDLAQILTAEQGKPLAEARGEIAYAASFIEYYAEEAKRAHGATIPTPSSDRRIFALKQPIGVVAAITPWNFPSAMITRKVGPALAAGCTAVVKPAMQTPLSAFALAELGRRAGLPNGVLNIITGKASEIGAVLTGSPKVMKVTFTGSTGVGKILMQQAASTVKKVSLELGGNAPFIVFEDADLDAAVEGAIASKFRNTGQTCVCTNRFLVQEEVYDAFLEKMQTAVKALNVGEGTQDGVTQGPLIDQAAADKVAEHVADATAKGARILTGGTPHALGRSFYEPTLIADATVDMLVAQEETFGPVAPVFKFKTEEEALALANNTPFGLASYFYARDIGRIWRVAEALECGIVGVNAGIISTEVAPFGGWKESGIGREGSPWGLDEYLELKYVALAGL
ncbi:MAG: succinate-semialdehyde dehydrogenase/glutarate-semialdehyde dehydrogenase [Parvibaculaceae bacterium]|jgi:succinate-semialdehyde dehydrogenase/glutarate-semialdehyde dehydrogenase|nr:NAD-dependent succinate-semialdehyde dehydrogenase [Parvibaculaceae bacterium]